MTNRMVLQGKPRAQRTPNWDRRLQEIMQTVDRIIAEEESDEVGYHLKQRDRVAKIFEEAVEIGASKILLGIFISSDRAKALKRPPKVKSGVLRALLQLAFLKPRQASSIFRAMKPFWDQNTDSAVVREHVENNGVYEAATAAGLRQPLIEDVTDDDDFPEDDLDRNDDKISTRDVLPSITRRPPPRRRGDAKPNENAHQEITALISRDFVSKLIEERLEFGDNLKISAVWLDNDEFGLPVLGLEDVSSN